MPRFMFTALAACAALLSALPTQAQYPGQKVHELIAADKGKVAIIEPDGRTIRWEVPNNFVCHDIQVLSGGNVLMPVSSTKLVEMTPDKKIVWEYESKPQAPYTGKVEVHGFQRLANGLTMIPETGNRRIIEVDKNGKIVHETPLTIEHPDSHRDIRLARKLDNGNYLVCHEGDGKVREYAPDGKVVWSYALDLDNRPETPTHQGHGTHVFGAIRLNNGNTMIACGDGNRVIEVTPQGKEVWRVGYDDLPGIRFFWVTTLQMLPNGNLIIGNTHAGPENPQLVEVTRDKKVVWTFKNRETFGNDLCAAQVLDVRGKVIR